MDNMDKWWISHKAWETKFMFKSLLSKLVVLWDASLNYKVNNFAFKTMCKFGVRKVLFSLRIKSIILPGVSENTRNNNLPNDKGTQGVFFSHFTFDCYWHSLATDGGPVLADKFSWHPCNSVILSDSSSHSPVSSGPGTLWCRRILSPYAPT